MQIELVRMTTGLSNSKSPHRTPYTHTNWNINVHTTKHTHNTHVCQVPRMPASWYGTPHLPHRYTQTDKHTLTHTSHTWGRFQGCQHHGMGPCVCLCHYKTGGSQVASVYCAGHAQRQHRVGLFRQVSEAKSKIFTCQRLVLCSVRAMPNDNIVSASLDKSVRLNWSHLRIGIRYCALCGPCPTATSCRPLQAIEWG